MSGTIASPEDFKKFIEKDESGPHCGICRQFYNRSVTNVRNHIESKHFPNSFLYTCPNCSINVNTKVALDRHATRCKVADNSMWNKQFENILFTQFSFAQESSLLKNCQELFLLQKISKSSLKGMKMGHFVEYVTSFQTNPSQMWRTILNLSISQICLHTHVNIVKWHSVPILH